MNAKRILMVFLVLAVVFSTLSVASAGFFDGLTGGGASFLDLKMTIDGGDFEDGDTSVSTENYQINFYNISADSYNGRLATLAEFLSNGSSTKLDENTVSDAFASADSSISDVISLVYDKDSTDAKCSKTITAFNQLSDYKGFEVDGRPAADFIVSDTVMYDESGSMAPDYLYYPENANTSTDLQRWVLIYDESTSTLYGVEIQSIKTSVLTDKTVLQSDEVQSIIDSMTFE